MCYFKYFFAYYVHYVDNQSLSKLTIGSRCFLDCEICEISSNSSLSKLYIDGMSFPFCSDVTIAGKIQWKWFT